MTLDKTASYTRRAPAAPSPHGDNVIQGYDTNVADKYRIGYENGWDDAAAAYTAGRNAGETIARGGSAPEVPLKFASGLLNDIYKKGKASVLNQ